MPPAATTKQPRQRIGATNPASHPGEEVESQHGKEDAALGGSTLGEGVSSHGTRRGIKSRQAQMLAIGGTIGAWDLAAEGVIYQKL